MLNVPNVFTQGAMKALVQAQISAASMGHEKMGSGHLLCGLCRVGDELTRCILGDLTAGEIEEEVLRRCGRGEVGFSRVTGLTPHAQRALLRAVTYANPEKKILAGIAHIWQELLYEDGCTALIVLDSLGLTVDAMRTVLLNTVGEIERPLQATRIAASSEPISRQEAGNYPRFGCWNRPGLLCNYFSADGLSGDRCGLHCLYAGRSEAQCWCLCRTHSVPADERRSALLRLRQL